MPLATHRPEQTPAHAITSFEFAELLGVSGSYFHRLQKKGSFPAPSIGFNGTYIYDRETAARYALAYVEKKALTVQEQARQEIARLAALKAMLNAN
ncbi:hypothetical protein NRB36_004315 [Salmonella enterica]|nr:hypothetical protein [Salmonella enterica]EJO1639674.1 hypothetical protein [Salmonella enterica]